MVVAVAQLFWCCLPGGSEYVHPERDEIRLAARHGDALDGVVFVVVDVGEDRRIHASPCRARARNSAYSVVQNKKHAVGHGTHNYPPPSARPLRLQIISGAAERTLLSAAPSPRMYVSSLTFLVKRQTGRRTRPTHAP